MKKVALTAASVAMVAMAASPAIAQDDNSVTDNSINDSGNVSTDVQYQSQDCSVIIGQYNTAVSGDATASGEGAIAATAAAVNAPVDVVQNCVLGGGDVVVGGGGVVADDGGEDGGDYVAEDGGDYGVYSEGEDGDDASASYSVLPDTGGASLIALGAGALLVAGGLVARRIVR